MLINCNYLCKWVFLCVVAVAIDVLHRMYASIGYVSVDTCQS